MLGESNGRETIAVTALVVALAGTILPAGMFVAGRMDLDQ